jgi:hypothetical protein
LQNETLACNDIVTLLANRIGPHAKAELLNVPVFIPQEFAGNPETFASIRRFLTSHQSYRNIFGNARAGEQPRGGGFVTSMDTIITGFGSADNYTVLHRFLPSWLNPEESDAIISYCAKGSIAGDLGGHFISSWRESGEGGIESFLAGINSRLIAATPRDFEAVAQRHARNRHAGAGVVGIAAGGRKARILHALLSRTPSPLSRLFIDSHCGLVLLSLLDRKRYNDLMGTDGFAQRYSVASWSAGTRRLMSL